MEKIDEMLNNLSNQINEINVNENNFTYKSILEFVKANVNDDTSVKSVLPESPINPKDKIMSDAEINELDDGYETDDESEVIKFEPVILESAFYDVKTNETISELN